MPPASQTDVGWVPPEVKKRLKEEAKATTAAEAEAKAAEAGANKENA
jgi:NADH-quinone oxidoreductase subunit B